MKNILRFAQFSVVLLLGALSGCGELSDYQGPTEPSRSDSNLWKETLLPDSAILRGSYREGAAPQSIGAEIRKGDMVTITIIEGECASQGTITSVSGPVSGVISSNACHDVGASITLGPSPSDGILSFVMDDPRFGPGSFRVSGGYPRYTVFLEDGFGDGDFNDNVLSVIIFQQDDCATGDEVLDNTAVRETLIKSIHDSGTFDSAPSARREIGGYIYQTADGSIEVRINPDPGATPCSMTPGGPNLQPGEKLIGAWHTHPFKHGDTLPANCGLPQGATYTNRQFGGGSERDWEFIQGHDIPMYIIDKEKVFRLDPNTPIKDRKKNPNKFDWNSKKCKWEA